MRGIPLQGICDIPVQTATGEERTLAEYRGQLMLIDHSTISLSIGRGGPNPVTRRPALGVRGSLGSHRS